MTGIHWRTTERGYLVGEFRDIDYAPGVISQLREDPVVSVGLDGFSVCVSRDQARLLGSLLTAFADTGDLRQAVDLVALGVKKGAE